jgi:hypothetical protein
MFPAQASPGHDLLFDSGLQFRPTSGRSKLDASPYWAALLQELETGCTCASFDYDHQPTTLLCACSQSPRAPSEPLLAFSRQYPVVTVRMPSRIKPLLTELLAVLLNIIQPLPPACAGVYMQEPTTGPVGARHQAVQHAAQAAALHAVLDPDLIVQEIEPLCSDAGPGCRCSDRRRAAVCARGRGVVRRRGRRDAPSFQRAGNNEAGALPSAFISGLRLTCARIGHRQPPAANAAAVSRSVLTGV